MQRLVQLQLDTLRQLGELEGALETRSRMVSTSRLAEPDQRFGPGLPQLPARGQSRGRRIRMAQRTPQFACCLGLEPSHVTGGGCAWDPSTKTRRCVPATLLIPRRALTSCAQPASRWIAGMLERRPFNVVATAGRSQAGPIMWAMAAHGREYDRTGYPGATRQGGKAPRDVGVKRIEWHKLPERVRVRDDETSGVAGQTVGCVCWAKLRATSVRRPVGEMSTQPRDSPSWPAAQAALQRPDIRGCNEPARRKLGNVALPQEAIHISSAAGPRTKHRSGAGAANRFIEAPRATRSPLPLRLQPVIKPPEMLAVVREFINRLHGCPASAIMRLRLLEAGHDLRLPTPRQLSERVLTSRLR